MALAWAWAWAWAFDLGGRAQRGGARGAARSGSGHVTAAAALQADRRNLLLARVVLLPPLARLARPVAAA